MSQLADAYDYLCSLSFTGTFFPLSVFLVKFNEEHLSINEHPRSIMCTLYYRCLFSTPTSRSYKQLTTSFLQAGCNETISNANYSNNSVHFLYMDI